MKPARLEFYEFLSNCYSSSLKAGLGKCSGRDIFQRWARLLCRVWEGGSLILPCCHCGGCLKPPFATMVASEQMNTNAFRACGGTTGHHSRRSAGPNAVSAAGCGPGSATASERQACEALLRRAWLEVRAHPVVLDDEGLAFSELIAINVWCDF